MISPKNKLLLKRFFARRLRALVDFLDGRLHAWEVSLRAPIEPVLPAVSEAKRGPEKGSRQTIAGPARVSFIEWEARRSGVAPIAKVKRRIRQHYTAAEFDRELREHFSRSGA